MKTLATMWAFTTVATGMTIATTAMKGISPIVCASWTLCGICFGLAVATTAFKASKQR